MTNSPTARFGPPPIIFIHVLAFVGVLFWLVMIVRALTGEFSSPGRVIALGVVLGVAHVSISVLASRHSRWAYAAMWVIFAIDTALAIFVDWKAVLLVLFTCVLLLLTRVPSARGWLSEQGMHRGNAGRR